MGEVSGRKNAQETQTCHLLAGGSNVRPFPTLEIKKSDGGGQAEGLCGVGRAWGGKLQAANQIQKTKACLSLPQSSGEVPTVRTKAQHPDVCLALPLAGKAPAMADTSSGFSQEAWWWLAGGILHLPAAQSLPHSHTPSTVPALVCPCLTRSPQGHTSHLPSSCSTRRCTHAESRPFSARRGSHFQVGLQSATRV